MEELKMDYDRSGQSITVEEAFGKIKNVLDSLPCFELNVKRWNDILYLVKEWKLYDCSSTSKNEEEK